MTMMTIDGDFTHLREIAHPCARDTALQHKMQLQDVSASQRRGYANCMLANALFYCRIQEAEFNIIDIIRAGRLKSVPQRSNSPEDRDLPPPCFCGTGANAKVPLTHPRKKFPTPPSYEVLT